MAVLINIYMEIQKLKIIGSMMLGKKYKDGYLIS